MISANKTKIFFIFLLIIFLIFNIVEIKFDKLQFESSQLSNFLISENAVKFIVDNHTCLTKKELDDVVKRYPKTYIMTFQNRASYRCIGFYSNKLNVFNNYITSGRFFYKGEIEDGANKVLVGKNILNSLNNHVKIVKRNLKTYAVIDEVEYEIIGVIGGKAASSLDNLVVFSIFNLQSDMYYLDSSSVYSKEKAFSYVSKIYLAQEIERQSNTIDSVIKTDLQFEILKIIQTSIKAILTVVLAYLAYKINRNMICSQYIIGLPIIFTIRESCKNIIICSLIAWIIVPIVSIFQICSLQESFSTTLKYLYIEAFLLLIDLLLCIRVYWQKQFIKNYLSE